MDRLVLGRRYEWEGRIYGQAIARNSPNAKIAVHLQNDSFGQDNLRGVPGGPRPRTSNIVGLESYEARRRGRSPADVARATGATILVMFAIPTAAVPAYPIANALRWSPSVIYTSSVAATDTFLTLSRARAGATSWTRPSPSST